MQNTIDTIYDRRSIRKYLDKPVNPDLIDEVLKAGMFAPSASNKQPYHFIVFDKRDKINELKDLHPYARTLETAPACILVCGDTKQQMADGFYVCDCSALCENMLLAAKSLGLDTCWMGVYPWADLMKEMAEHYCMPENVVPFAIVAIGYGAEQKERPRRYDSSKIHYNKW